MSELQHLQLKDSYDSDTDEILEELIRPALSCSSSYLRSVGYLDSKMLCNLGRELEGMARHDGQVKMLLGVTVSSEQYRAVKDGFESPDAYLTFPDLDALWMEIDNDAERRGLVLLSWLVAKRVLEVRFSIRPRGIHHEKFALLRDDTGAEIILHGTNNETENANVSGGNFESLSVYRSWEPEIYARFAEPKLRIFLRQWNNQTKESVTVSAPNSLLERFLAFSESIKKSTVFKSLYDEVIADLAEQDRIPDIPLFWGDKRYELKAHQIAAIKTWQENDYNAIFKMATGSGKTITAIHAATLLGREITGTHVADFFVVVCVPYQILADQWCDNLANFGYSPLRAYESKHNWLEGFRAMIDLSTMNPKGRIHSIVVVNRTLADPDFQAQLGDVDSEGLLFIADECHRVGNLVDKSLLPAANFKIGLSATPWAKREEVLRNQLIKYFGEGLASYSLANAFEDRMLVPYEYLVIEVALDEDESSRYNYHAREAKRLYALKLEGLDVDARLNRHLNEKGAILGSCGQKFDELDQAMEWLNEKTSLKHLLVYCGSGSTEDDLGNEPPQRDIVRAQNRCRSVAGLEGSRITYEEKRERRNVIVDALATEAIQAIFAIRVLDEGFDMPSIRGAVLMASSRNERQFIQRRGRVLRKHSGKEQAFIVDFIVKPHASMDSDLGGELVFDELCRIVEFSQLALNKTKLVMAYERIAADWNVKLENVYERIDLDWDEKED